MIRAQYPGRCQCGARFDVGAAIVLAEGYRVRGARPVIFCPSCRPVLTPGATVGVYPPEWRYGGVYVTLLHDRGGVVAGFRVDSMAADSFGKAWAIARIDGDRCGFTRFGPEWGGTGGDELAAWIAGYVLALDPTAYRVAA